ncbi:hypothetical protein CPB84DRAFT_1794150 [Gymnopilus junonius]|uniref:F-box domain-containing protein n=1 Tax=Gymnopilus junonius TaxID=109634 RepID=A0A9P5THK0_GYMJU|nr:hypothetical protein CPB84DRAFT_1794150 [Gymnopilus junonius]
MDMQNAQVLKTYGSFAKLGTDVIINVAKFLRPCDIISLRKTCKLLQQVTRMRTIWINALRSIMARNAITEDTYPLQKMALPILKHVALSPHRFASLVMKSNEVMPLPTSIRAISPRMTNWEKERYEIELPGPFIDFWMAPGGRYVVTLSMQHDWNESTLFTVWDVGLSGRDVIKPLTRFLEKAQGLRLVCFFADSQNLGFFYIVSTQNSPSFSVLVHKASLSSPPKIDFLAKLEIPTSPGSNPPVRFVYLLPESCRILVRSLEQEKCSFRIWDFLNNAVADVIMRDCPVEEKIEVFCCDNCFIVALKDRLIVCNIPTLVPYIAGKRLIEHEASIIISAPLKSADSFYIEPNPMSPLASNVPPYILRVNDKQVAFLEAKEANPVHDPMLPNRLPVTRTIVNIANDTFRKAAMDGTVERCEEYFFLTNPVGSSMVTIMNAECLSQNEGTGGLSLFTTTLDLYVTIDVEKQQLCPLLGRDCVLTGNGDVFIFDYLVSPE